MKKYVAFYRRKRFGKVEVMVVGGYETKKELSKDMKAIGLKVISILSDEEFEYNSKGMTITISTEDTDEILHGDEMIPLELDEVDYRVLEAGKLQQLVESADEEDWEEP